MTDGDGGSSARGRKPRVSLARAAEVAAEQAVAHEARLAETTRAARKAAKRGRSRQRATFLDEMHGEVDQAALSEAFARRVTASDAGPGTPPGGRGAVRRARGIPTSDTGRWVPIGPSVVRLGQAVDHPRVTGRVVDLAVSDDGSRAYAATAKGGVWFSRDGGSTWGPVGGWAEVARGVGGSNNAQTCGALLVSFVDDDPAHDVVLVGTGEITPRQSATGSTAQGGVGVLAAVGPATRADGVNPWLPDTGLAALEGSGIYRLARHPEATPMVEGGAHRDRVLAATSTGIHLGEWKTLPATASLPARPGYEWTKQTNFNDNLLGPGQVVFTDVLWLPGGDPGRVVVAIDDFGVFVTDDLCATQGTEVADLVPEASWFVSGRITLARGSGHEVWAVGERQRGKRRSTRLWRMTDLADVTVAAPAATIVTGVPDDLWGAQGYYDQALAVDRVGGIGGVDRIYLGGSTVQPTPGAEWSASLWCFETAAGVGTSLAAAAGVSRVGAPSPPATAGGTPGGGDGADRRGLVGNNVHADVHTIRVVGAASPNRQVWVGCDGGVFVSGSDGRVNTFAPRHTGLASLEPIFVAGHPTSSQLVVTGFQDNGAQVRIGDTLWEETFAGDGGGCAFHPIRSDLVMAQYTNAGWLGSPSSRFRDPLSRTNGGTTFAAGVRESDAALFYSGMAVTATSATGARTAIGTNRVWLSETADGARTWVVLRNDPGGAVSDPRPGGSDAGHRTFGVPGLGGVVTLVWSSPDVLWALYQRGLVRHERTGPTAWAASARVRGAGAGELPVPGLLTDIAPVSDTLCYVTTTGAPTDRDADTVFLVDHAAAGGGTVTATRFRRELDDPPPPAVAVTKGPLDPVYAVVVDPALPTRVYVGTATGVWVGVRGVGATHAWDTFVNGLPQATVQDLDVWPPPAPPGAPAPPAPPADAPHAPRLLRAGVQSRGIWEVDLAGDEVRRTYVRVHPNDDRRRLPTPMARPRLAPGAPPHDVWASPDIVVRPAWPRAAAPPFRATIVPTNPPAYELWTFQTALRWRHPHVVADGAFSAGLRDTVAQHRVGMGLSGIARIDRAVWDDVVGGIRLDASSRVTTDGTGDLAVYRAPWQTALAPTAPGTEIDLLDLVRPVNADQDWTAYRERVTVDVLLHHRDSRRVPVDGARAVVLWMAGPDRDALLATTVADVPAYVASLLGPGPALPSPGGWNAAPAGASGVALHRELEARLPLSVSVDIDLGGVTQEHVLVLAVVGSSVDAPVVAPLAGTVTVADLVRNWPYAALRAVTLIDRPPPPP